MTIRLFAARTRKHFGRAGRLFTRLGGQRSPNLTVCLLGLALVALSVSAPAQETAFTRAASVLQPQAYVSLQPVPRGSAFEIAVVAKITPGFHVNAHEPSEEYLIPTKVTADLPAGITVVETDYPRGVMRAFQFSKTPLRVYDGSFTVRMKLRAGNAAAMGHQKIPLTIGYQACNQDSCLPPTKIPRPPIWISPPWIRPRTRPTRIFSRGGASKSPAKH